MIKVRPNVQAAPVYRPPWVGIDRIDYLRLDLNENTQPPPKPVADALKRWIDDGRVQLYPDYVDFMPKLAGYAGLSADHLLVTNGSDQGIDIVLRAFLGPGDSLLVAQPEFPMFSIGAQVIDARVKGVPFRRDFSFPESEFLAAIEGDERLIVLISPNNPTGTPVPPSLIPRVLRLCPDVPVLVDEAYFEYTGETALPLLGSHPNLILLRTFSKAFAMAGLRLGYLAAAPQLIDQFAKIRGPFDVNSPALVAAAAQLDGSPGWKSRVEEIMQLSKPRLLQALKTFGVRFCESPAHFLLVWPPDRDRAVEDLKRRGILVRPMSAAMIEDSFRMCVGTLEETERFIEAFGAHLQSIRGDAPQTGSAT